MPHSSLWSDEQSGHSWLPAAEPETADYPKPTPPTEEHTHDRPARVGFPTLLIVACVVGTVTAALVELVR